MGLMVFPEEKMTAEFKELLDLKLRERVASDVNKAILESRGERAEAKIRQLVRARVWASEQAHEAQVDLPESFMSALGSSSERNGVAGDGDAVMTQV